MDERRFDAITRYLATDRPSRRGVLRGLLSTALGALLTTMGAEEGVARRRCRGSCRECSSDDRCCSKQCVEGICRCLEKGPCRRDLACCSGRCRNGQCDPAPDSGCCIASGQNLSRDRPCTPERAARCCSGSCRDGRGAYCCSPTGGDCQEDLDCCNQLIDHCVEGTCTRVPCAGCGSQRIADRCSPNGPLIVCDTSTADLCCEFGQHQECCIDCATETPIVRCCTPGVDCAPDGGPCAASTVVAANFNGCQCAEDAHCGPRGTCHDGGCREPDPPPEPGVACSAGDDYCRQALRSSCSSDPSYPCQCLTSESGTTLCADPLRDTCGARGDQPSCQTDADCAKKTGPGSICYDYSGSTCQCGPIGARTMVCVPPCRTPVA